MNGYVALKHQIQNDKIQTNIKSNLQVKIKFAVLRVSVVNLW